MSRFVLQSGRSFEFLFSNPRTGDVGFTPSLLQALRFGVVDDPENVAQLVSDHFDKGSALVVDLDADYPD